MDDRRKIWKYEIFNIDKVEKVIKVPAGAEVLSVMEQNNGIVLYAMVPYDNDFPEISKELYINVVGTGHVIDFPIGPTDFKFIGTVSIFNGEVMFHVFYKDGHYYG